MASLKKLRIQPTPVLLDLTENNAPMESVIGPETAHLDDKFKRILQRPPSIQKDFIQQQVELYHEEQILMDQIAGDLRDFLTHTYEYNMREKPITNLDLFCELGYQSFKRRRSIHDLLQMVLKEIDNFNDLAILSSEGQTDPEDEENVFTVPTEDIVCV